MTWLFSLTSAVILLLQLVFNLSERRCWRLPILNFLKLLLATEHLLDQCFEGCFLVLDLLFRITVDNVFFVIAFKRLWNQLRILLGLNYLQDVLSGCSRLLRNSFRRVHFRMVVVWFFIVVKFRNFAKLICFMHFCHSFRSSNRRVLNSCHRISSLISTFWLFRLLRRDLY